MDSSAFKYFVFLHKRQDPIDKEYLKNRKKLYQQLTDIAVDNAELIDSIVILEKTGKNIVYNEKPVPVCYERYIEREVLNMPLPKENYGCTVDDIYALPEENVQNF